jgi:hypothetical protein
MMSTMRQSWTDERLDDFRAEVGHRFDVVDQRFDRVEREVHGLRVEMRTEFTAVRSEMKAGFERMYRLMVSVGAGLIGTLIAASAGLIATQL